MDSRARQSSRLSAAGLPPGSLVSDPHHMISTTGCAGTELHHLEAMKPVDPFPLLCGFVLLFGFVAMGYGIWMGWPWWSWFLLYGAGSGLALPCLCGLCLICGTRIGGARDGEDD